MRPEVLLMLAEYKYPSDSNLLKLKEDVIKMLSNDVDTCELLGDLEKENKRADCSSYDNRVFSSAFLGAAHYNLDEFQIAARWFDKAATQFRGQDSSWNEVIALKDAGQSYQLGNQSTQAGIEYKKAIHALTKYIKIHRTDYSTESQALFNSLEVLILAAHMPGKKDQAETSEEARNPVKPLHRNRLILPWIPVYTGIRATPGGPIWDGPLPKNSPSDIEIVNFDDRQYIIQSLNPSDKQITLSEGRKYGWAKVFGDSMNAIPILEGDYVLFYENPDAEDNAVVLASCKDPAGAGLEYVVKRYDKLEKQLLSETEPPNSYNPIPIKGDTRILGIVIAVAKPL
jgi:tetratricopeptide (TPR) repeat protein